MAISINEVKTTMHAFDGDSPLPPGTMQKIIQTVLAAVDDRDSHRSRVRAEQRITNGVSHEQEERE